MDAVVKHKYESDRDFVVEIKSINPEGFRTLPQVSMDAVTNFSRLMECGGMTGTRVRKYMQQLQIYIREMQMDEGILLFDNKGNQDFLAYHIVHDAGYTDAMIERLQSLQEHWGE